MLSNGTSFADGVDVLCIRCLTFVVSLLSLDPKIMPNYTRRTCLATFDSTVEERMPLPFLHCAQAWARNQWVK